MSDLLITVDDMQDALSPILAGITGMQRVFAQYPDVLNWGNVPALIFHVGAWSYSQNRERGAYALRITWQWVGHLYVQVASEGREFEAEAAVLPYLTRLPGTLAQYPTVRLSSGQSFDLSLHQGGGDGPQPLTYGNQRYAGAIFRWSTITEQRITPAQ